MERHLFFALVAGLPSVLLALSLAKPHGVPPERRAAVPVDTPESSAESPLRDRRAFARRLAQVREGMTRVQVRRLLGEPDDRWLGEEVNACREGMVYRAGKEAWTYGGNGHLTFPTLGKVSFDHGGKVVNVLGQGERLPGAALPPEAETRRILRLMERLRGYDQRNDPLRVIQVVNALQPLGKVGALAVIDEFLRITEGWGDGQDGLFVVVRCLFNVPDPPGYFPMMGVGAPSPEAPKDLRRSPRFPVVLYRDIPFSGINGYSLGGTPEPLAAHLEPYRAWGTVRAQPLRPPDNPLEVIDGLVSSPEWPDWGEQKAWGKSIAREQVLRLVDPVYRVEEVEFDLRLTGYYTDQEPQWRNHLRRFVEQKAHWDPVRSTYVRADGTSLPPLSEPYTYPRTWHAQTPAGEITVALQRHHRTSVTVSYSAHHPKPPMPLLRMFIRGAEVKTGWDQHIPAEGSTTTGFPAPPGSDIRLVLERNGHTLAETVLRP